MKKSDASNSFNIRKFENFSGYIPNAPISPEAIPHATDLNSVVYGGYTHPVSRNIKNYNFEYRNPIGLGPGSGINPFTLFPSNNVVNVNGIISNRNDNIASTSAVNSSNSKSSTPSSSRIHDTAETVINRSRKQRKKAEKEERDRQKQAEKKKRRLEKALATAAAIRSELEKKKQKRKEEEKRLDLEGAALAEAVALHVLVDEDSAFRRNKSQSQSEGSNRQIKANLDSDQEDEDDFSNGSGDSDEDEDGRLSRDRTGETASSAECNSISVTSRRDFDDVEIRFSQKETITSNQTKIKNQFTLISEESNAKSIHSHHSQPSSSPSPSPSLNPTSNPNHSFIPFDKNQRHGILNTTTSILLETVKIKDENTGTQFTINESSSLRQHSSNDLYFVDANSMDENKKEKMVVKEAEMRAICSSDKAKQAEIAASFAAVQAMAAIKIAEEARVEAEAARKAANDAMRSAMDRQKVGIMDYDEEGYGNAEEERNALKIKLENTQKLLNEKNNYISELERVLEDLKAKIECSRLQSPTNQESSQK